MGLADIGSAIARGRVQKASGTPPVVGFTNPSTISDDINAIDHAADSLQTDWARDVPSGSPERNSFETWRTTVWKPFRDKNLGAGRLSSGLFFGTDELMAQTQARRAELSGFADRYKAQTQKDPSTPTPVDPRTQPQAPAAGPSWWPKWAPTPTVSVPWWVWVGGTLAVLAGGYGAYRWYRVTRETEARYRENVFRVLPTVLGAQGGAAVAAHDVSCPSCHHGDSP
jgi:hypothetical protein